MKGWTPSKNPSNFFIQKLLIKRPKTFSIFIITIIIIKKNLKRIKISIVK